MPDEHPSAEDQLALPGASAMPRPTSDLSDLEREAVTNVRVFVETGPPVAGGRWSEGRRSPALYHRLAPTISLKVQLRASRTRVLVWIDAGAGRAARNKAIFDRLALREAELTARVLSHVDARCELEWDRKDDYRGSAIELHVPAKIADLAVGDPAAIELVGTAALVVLEAFANAAPLAVQEAEHPEGDVVAAHVQVPGGDATTSGDSASIEPIDTPDAAGSQLAADAPDAHLPEFDAARASLVAMLADGEIDLQSAESATHLLDAAAALVLGARTSPTPPLTADSDEVWRSATARRYESATPRSADSSEHPPVDQPAAHDLPAANDLPAAAPHPAPTRGPATLHCPGCEEALDLERLSGSSLDLQTYLCRSCGTLFEHNPLSCPRCGSDDTSVDFVARGRRPGYSNHSWGTVAIRACADCGWRSA